MNYRQNIFVTFVGRTEKIKSGVYLFFATCTRDITDTCVVCGKNFSNVIIASKNTVVRLKNYPYQILILKIFWRMNFEIITNFRLRLVTVHTILRKSVESCVVVPITRSNITSNRCQEKRFDFVTIRKAVVLSSPIAIVSTCRLSNRFLSVFKNTFKFLFF